MILLPSVFVPSIAYMHCVVNHSHCAIYVGECYRKQTYRNRCDLLTAGGATSVTIPVQHISYPPPETQRVLLSEHGAWRARLLQTVMSSYGSSPFFEHYIDAVRALIAYTPDTLRLVDYNQAWLHFICEEIGVPTPSIVSQYAEDDHFDAEIAARHYQPSQSALRPYWQPYQERYGFVSNLSVIDLLFNVGYESILYLT